MRQQDTHCSGQAVGRTTPRLPQWSRTWRYRIVPPFEVSVKSGVAQPDPLSLPLSLLAGNCHPCPRTNLFPLSPIVHSCLGSLIRTKEPLTVEMDDVAWCLSDPDLGLPRDFGEVLRHGSSREECSHEDQPSLGLFE